MNWFAYSLVLIPFNLPTVHSENCTWNGYDLSSLGELRFNTSLEYYIKFCGIASECHTLMACLLYFPTNHIYELIDHESSMELLSAGGGSLIFQAFGNSTDCPDQKRRKTIVNVTCHANSFLVIEHATCSYLMNVPVPPSMRDSFCSTPASLSAFLIIFICIFTLLAVAFGMMYCYVAPTTSYNSIRSENTVQISYSYSPIQRQRMQAKCLTATIRPGNRFLDIIPNCNDTTLNDICTSLTSYAESHKLDNTVAVLFQDKVEDLMNEGHSQEKSLSLALLWLYTYESWVYQEINRLLRDDSSLMKDLAPCIYGLILSFKHIDEQYLYFGTVYIRTKLTDKEINFYLQESTFVWSSFTSTTTEFSPDITFGDVLFVISIKKEYRFCAISLEEISAVPLEKEILLLPNLGFVVKNVKKGTEANYTNVKMLFEIELKYVIW